MTDPKLTACVAIQPFNADFMHGLDIVAVTGESMTIQLKIQGK